MTEGDKTMAKQSRYVVHLEGYVWADSDIEAIK